MGRKINLSPSGDEWFETEEVPALIINVEGNFDTIQNGLRNQGVLELFGTHGKHNGVVL